MANHLESNLVAFNASLLLKQLGEGPFLKEIAKSYQLDLQCTLNLESLLSQENLQSEGQQEGGGLQDKIRVVIKELVTVKNHYFHILIQALSLLQKQQQRISAKSVFLQLHNVINSHKDSQISTLKSIIKSLGFDSDSRTLPSKTDIQGLQERVNGSNREDIVSKIKQSNSINLDRSNSQNYGNPTQKPNSSRSRPTSTHKRNPSFAKDTMSGSYTAQTLSSKNLNNNVLQKRYSDCKKETHLSQELLNIAQRYKGAAETRRPMTEKKSGVRDVVTSVFNQDVKQAPTRKTQKSPIRSAGNSAPSTQKNQKRQTKGDLFENLIDALRIESVELPKGVRLFTEKNHTQSQLNTQRSAEILNTEYVCQEKLVSAHGSTILSRSPDSTPNITPSGSRIYTTEDMSILNRKDSIDINALQKGLKKSCRKLMKRRASLESLRDRGVKEALNDEAGQRKVQRTRRSKSIGETPTYFYGPDESATFDVPVGKTNNKQASGKSSPVSEVKVGNFLQSQVVSDARNYNSQSSIAGSLLHDINSISCCNHVDVVIVNKDQENQGREELSMRNVKGKMQIYGLRDVSRVFEGRGNLSARNSAGYIGDVKQIYTERGCRPQEGNDPQMQRRKSLGRRDEPVKLEVMYGTKTMKKVKNWAPVLPKK